MKAVQYILFSTIAVGIAVVFVMFSWQNNVSIQVHLFAYSTPPFPISGYLMISFFLGMVFSSLFFTLPLLKMKASTMSLKKQIKKFEKELQQLRNQPLDQVPQNPGVEVAKLVDDETPPSPHYLQSP